MKTFLFTVVLAAFLVACSEKQEAKLPAPDRTAGKTLAEANCIDCHGLDGKGQAPAIPHLAAQLEEYLLTSLNAYKEGSRMHAALRDMTSHMSEADLRNVAAYYAALPPIATATGQKEPQSPFEKGKLVAAGCKACHGELGNSKIAGTPSLAGQQSLYLIAAVQAYLDGSRHIDTMEAMLRGKSKLDIENMAHYFASQAPMERTPPTTGDPNVGAPLTAMCGGCHGSHGVSFDAATPTLAAQDPQYLVTAMSAYRDKKRNHELMHNYVAHLSDQDMEHIAAFYAVQKSIAAESEMVSVQDQVSKCDLCHGPTVSNSTMAVPKIAGQNKDYLIMALRAYRDGKRNNSMMHNMSLPYTDAVVESLAEWYAYQPAR